MALGVNPKEFTAAGQSYAENCRIGALVWSGTTTAGDVVYVKKLSDGTTVWRSQASGANTYQGLVVGDPGIPCPDGFTITTMTAGTYLLVYFVEV